MGVELVQELVGVELVGTRRRGTSATDKSQSRNSSPSKTYTCTILLNINVQVLKVEQGLELMHLVDVEELLQQLVGVELVPTYIAYMLYYLKYN